VLVTFLDAGEATEERATPAAESTPEFVRELNERLRQADQLIESMRDDHFLTTAGDGALAPTSARSSSARRTRSATWPPASTPVRNCALVRH
jgi:hypothetical protein